MKYYRLLIIALFAITSCSKNNPTPDPTQTGTTGEADIYVAGEMIYPPHGMSAVYWKNGILKRVSDSTSTLEYYAKAITVRGNDVYVLGGITTLYNNSSVYWKNGVMTSLGESSATSIDVKGTDVYVAGTHKITPSHTAAVYWKNGIPINLDAPDEYGSEANSITVSGSDVYVAGAISKIQPKAVYWKNGVPISLPGGLVSSAAMAIAIVGNDIYVSGFILNSTLPYKGGAACYWKNGILHMLSDDSNSSIASTIAVNGTNVYFAGISPHTSSLAQIVYWKNDAPVTITTFNQVTEDIVPFGVNGGDAYAVIKNSSFFGASYWKNTTKIDLTLPYGGATAHGITVVPR